MLTARRNVGPGLAPVLSLLVVVSCVRPAASPPARHLVFVTIDTLRADRVGCYGSRDVATPHLDRLAVEGARAADATVHVPVTRPSHVSLFTGLYPSEHGVRNNVSASLPSDFVTLAETLQSAGFATAAFLSSIVLSSQSGLNQGFETYSDSFELDPDGARFLNTVQKRGDVTAAEAIEWLQRQVKERVFLWIHLYEPHDPYEPPEPYASRYAGRPYDGEVAFTDEIIGRIDSALESLHLRSETLFVVTSDHGEALGEHGESGHGFFIYETTLQVPLLFRGPGIPPGTVVKTTARTVDLLPTLIDLLGFSLPEKARVSGRSLAAVVRGGAEPSQEVTYAETLVPLVHFGWSDLHAVRRGSWKYIRAPRPELYDLATDPGESVNLGETQPGRTLSLRASLDEHLRRTAASPEATPDSVPPDLKEKLGALGYVGAPPAEDVPPDKRADPKDKIAEYEELNGLVREGLIRLQRKDYEGSVSTFRKLLARGNDSFEAHYYLARGLVALDRNRQALPHLEKAIERDPAFTPAYLDIANCRVALKDPNAALSALARAREMAPKDPRLHDRTGEILLKLGRRNEAARAFAEVAALAPKDALVRVRLGEIYRDLGDLKKAVSYLRQAVEIDPAAASYWNSLGMVLGGNGDLGGAAEAFRRAQSLDGSNAQYAYNLGLALLRQGHGDEAARFFSKALEIDPRFRPARERLAETEPR